MHVTRTILLAVLVSTAFALAGCSLSVPGSGTPAGGAYGLNETTSLTQENTTIDVTVIDYRFVETAQQTADGGTISPPAGTKFLYLQVRAENTGSENGATPAVAVRPASDKQVPEQWPTWMASDLYLYIRPLPAGATATGWTRHVVPANTTASDVEVAFSTDVVITSNEYDWRLD